MSALRIFPIGACQLQWPLYPLTKDGRVIQTTHRAGISEISCYTTAEALQRIRFCRGDIDLPKSLYFYCALLNEVDPTEGKLRSVEDADLAVFEPNSPLCTYFGSYALNRGKLLPVLDLLAEISPEARKATKAWFSNGLLACNHDRLREAAEVLVPLLPGHVDNVELVRELLLGMRGHRQDVQEFIAAIGEIKDMLAPLPLGLVAYIHQILPNGRLMPWPPDHLDNTLEAARRLDLPIFNPVETSLRHGVDRAMYERYTYRDEFREVLAEPLYDFCLKTAGFTSQKAEDPAPAVG